MQTIEAEVATRSVVTTSPIAGTDTPVANYEAVRFNAMKHGILSRLAKFDCCLLPTSLLLRGRSHPCRVLQAGLGLGT